MAKRRHNRVPFFVLDLFLYVAFSFRSYFLSHVFSFLQCFHFVCFVHFYAVYVFLLNWTFQGTFFMFEFWGRICKKLIFFFKMKDHIHECVPLTEWQNNLLNLTNRISRTYSYFSIFQTLSKNAKISFLCKLYNSSIIWFNLHLTSKVYSISDFEKSFSN